MPTTPTRQLCALLHDGRVLTDEAGRVPAYDSDGRHTTVRERAAAAGDSTAVMVAPQLHVHVEPLTLLTVFGPRAEPVPGVWTPVAELESDAATVAALQTVAAEEAGEMPTPARRAEWFSRDWYGDVERWVDGVLQPLGRRRSGPVEPQKMWSLSAVVRVPCSPGPSVWVKAACRHFHAEPALTRLASELVPEHTPTLVATDDERGWLSTEDMPGVDYLDQEPVPAVGAAAARAMASLQVRSLSHRAEMEAMGLPIRDLETTAHQVDEILAGSVELDQLTRDEHAAARAVRDDVRSLLEELAGLGIPDALVHGDLHTGNIALEDGVPILYDWSDAAVSHPFLDLVLLSERLSDEERAAAEEAYLEVWRCAYPDADVDRALELARPANTVFQMVSYEHIYRAQEDASYWEMRGVVARSLRELPATFGRHG